MKAFQRSLFFAFIVFCLCFAAGMLAFGCAPAQPPPPPFSIWHPFRDTTQTMEHMQHLLTFVNVGAFVVFCGSFGLLFISTLTWLSRIIMPIAGAVTAGTLIGVVSLPFMPWAIGATVVGLSAYEGYVWYKAKHPPVVK